jgi:carboxylate-amine ligase
MAERVGWLPGLHGDRVRSKGLGGCFEPPPTVGLEEELILVDPERLEPVDAVELVLATLDDSRYVPEFRAAQLELVMPPSVSVAGLQADLVAARTRLVERLAGKVRVIAAGTHPTSTAPVEVTGRPRYRRIAGEFGWATRRGLPSGLHIHVGVADPDEALVVYNSARGYLPDLAALAANSPYLEGADTGLASTRLKLSEDFPRSGIPPAFASWRTFDRFVSWGTEAGLFPDLTYLWWDLRPRPDLGTLEFRIADSQTSPLHAGSIAAVCQALVAALQARLRAGETLLVHPSHMLVENRWRALRDGLDAELVDAASGRLEPVRNRLARLVFELEPYAATLGCEYELAGVWPLIGENGAAHQRRIVSEQGLQRLLERLADATELTADAAEGDGPGPAAPGAPAAELAAG